MAKVIIDGLAELRRDLRRLTPETDREVFEALKTSGESTLEQARSRAPGPYKDPDGIDRPLQPGYSRLSEGGRVSVVQKAVSVKFDKRRTPHAYVVHWGGTIEPRPGERITFPRRPFLWEAAQESQAEFVSRLDRELDSVFSKLGW